MRASFLGSTRCIYWRRVKVHDVVPTKEWGIRIFKWIFSIRLCKFRLINFTCRWDNLFKVFSWFQDFFWVGYRRSLFVFWVFSGILSIKIHFINRGVVKWKFENSLIKFSIFVSLSKKEKSMSFFPGKDNFVSSLPDNCTKKMLFQSLYLSL